MSNPSALNIDLLPNYSTILRARLFLLFFNKKVLFLRKKQIERVWQKKIESAFFTKKAL